jgi:hypothetical protein
MGNREGGEGKGNTALAGPQPLTPNPCLSSHQSTIINRQSAIFGVGSLGFVLGSFSGYFSLFATS